jgi:hypothetical protein
MNTKIASALALARVLGAANSASSNPQGTVRLDTEKRRVRPDMTLVVLSLLFCAMGARADVFDITIINATFSATCIGGVGTCTEVVNGSFLGDVVNQTASSVSMALTGTLDVPLVFGTPTCTNMILCLGDRDFYYQGVPGDNPIEFSPSFLSFNEPTPVPLLGGPDGTALFIPGLCGGGVAACNTVGTFPTGNDYALTSGFYTSVDMGPSPTPEATSAFLVAIGVATLGLLSRRKLRSGRQARSVHGLN